MHNVKKVEPKKKPTRKIGKRCVLSWIQTVQSTLILFLNIVAAYTSCFFAYMVLLFRYLCSFNLFHVSMKCFGTSTWTRFAMWNGCLCRPDSSACKCYWLVTACAGVGEGSIKKRSMNSEKMLKLRIFCVYVLYKWTMRTWQWCQETVISRCFKYWETKKLSLFYEHANMKFWVYSAIFSSQLISIYLVIQQKSSHPSVSAIK